MRINLSYALVVASAIIGLAGCSIGARPSVPDPRFWSNESQSIVPKEMLDQGPNGAKLILRGPPAVANAGVYVAQFMEPTIGDYEVPDHKNAGPFCSVTGIKAVNGIGVQPKTGFLYIPNGGLRSVVIRRPFCGPEVGSGLDDPNGQPSDVAFDEKTGTVYVTDIYDNNGAPGTIQVYKKDEHTPSSQLSDPSMYQLQAIDTDKAGNVWQTYQTSAGAPGLIKFAGGKMPGQVHVVNGLTFPGGVEFAKNGDLIIVDINTSAPVAQVYGPPYSGDPIKTIPLKGGSVFAKLDAANKNLYVVSFTNSSMDVYKWPSGAYEYSVTAGITPGHGAEGVAVDLPDSE